MNPLYIVLAILIFGMLIFVHEAGHYIFARIFRVKIYEFSIGMGPKLISRTSKKTGIAYSLRLLPFGGFVSMAGEDEESEDENAFGRKPPLQRIVISAAGALVNIVLGIVVMTVLVASAGKLYSTQIDGFAETQYTSTSEMGLDIGDRIVRVGNTRVFTANDLQYEIMRQGIVPLDITVIRDGERVVINDVTFPSVSENGVAFGMRDFTLREEPKSFGTVLSHAAARSYSTIKMVYDSLFDLLRGRYSVSSVSGPVGVTKALGEAAASGRSNLLYLVSFISINLGVMNLLPLPALDGGRIVFLIIELIRRRPIPVKYEGMVHLVGFALLMLLLILVTFKDVVALF